MASRQRGHTSCRHNCMLSKDGMRGRHVALEHYHSSFRFRNHVFRIESLLITCTALKIMSGSRQMHSHTGVSFIKHICWNGRQLRKEFLTTKIGVGKVDVCGGTECPHWSTLRPPLPACLSKNCRSGNHIPNFAGRSNSQSLNNLYNVHFTHSLPPDEVCS